MILFLFLCCGIYVLSWVAEKRNSKAFLLFAILTAAMVAGFRAASVGFDTQNYLNILTNLRVGVWSPNVERPFQHICKVLLFIWNDSQWVLLFFAVITNALILGRFWTMRKTCPFSLMVLMYLVIYYANTMNIMRQFMAVAIIFFATLFLDKKKYILYLIFTVCAALIHTSAILGFAVLLVYTFFSAEDKRFRKRLLIICLAIVPIVVIGGVFLIQQYSQYLTQSNNSFGLMMPIRFIIAILTWLFCVRQTLPFLDGRERRYLPAVAGCAVTGVLLTACGYYTTTLARGGLYFMMFEIPLVAYAMHNGKYRVIPQSIYSLLLIYMLYIGIVGNGSGIFPFAFC